MTEAKLHTAIIGFGKIGAGYTDDPVMARYFKYATHAQVLATHPSFEWGAVVDSSPEALELARSRWGIKVVAKTVEELASRYQPDVLVLATPPESRLSFIDHFPSLRAVLVEKPLGLNFGASKFFLDTCERRGVLVQVNLLRRADKVLRELAAGKLGELVGNVQAVFGLYGNGLHNNGTHLIDLVRMLLGEVDAVQTLSGIAPYEAGVLQGDVQMPFALCLANGVIANFQPLRFEHYRENALDVWGENGRLLIALEGLGIFWHRRTAHRAVQDAYEIALDQFEPLESTLGKSFYAMYDNLANAILYGEPLWSSGISALQTTKVVEAILRSAEHNGVSVPV